MLQRDGGGREGERGKGGASGVSEGGEGVRVRLEGNKLMYIYGNFNNKIT